MLLDRRSEDEIVAAELDIAVDAKRDCILVEKVIFDISFEKELVKTEVAKQVERPNYIKFSVSASKATEESRRPDGP